MLILKPTVENMGHCKFLFLKESQHHLHLHLNPYSRRVFWFLVYKKNVCGSFLSVGTKPLWNTSEPLKQVLKRPLWRSQHTTTCTTHTHWYSSSLYQDLNKRQLILIWHKLSVHICFDFDRSSQVRTHSRVEKCSWLFQVDSAVRTEHKSMQWLDVRLRRKKLGKK